MMKLQIIIGSTRPGRFGLPISTWFTDIAKKNGKFDVEVIDLAEVNLPFLDEPNHPSQRKYTKQHTKDWSAKIDTADAYIFVMPEYNFGYSAVVKNAIDFLLQEWQYKPVSFVSYGGVSGGTRAVQLLKPVMTAMSMMPIYESVNIPFFFQYMKDSQFVGDEKLTASANAMLDKLAIWAKHFQPLRKEMKG